MDREGFDPFRDTLIRKFPELGPLMYDVSERDGMYTIRVALPGVKPEEIQITGEGSTLTITGETQEEEETWEQEYVIKDCREVRYTRSVTFAATVDAAKVTTSVADGMLTVTVPKVAVTRCQHIAVPA